MVGMLSGIPAVSAPILNGVTQTGGSGLYTNVAARSALLPMDTGQAQGVAPETVAATAFQVAAVASELIANAATSTAGAATLSTTGGLITTEALTTAPGATYTFVLTNALLAATSPAILVGVYNKSNTGGQLAVSSVTNGAGISTIVFTNIGTTALNGTIMIAFHI